MSDTHIRLAGTMRPQDSLVDGHDGDHDARRLRAALSYDGWRSVRENSPRMGRGVSTARSPLADEGPVSRGRRDSPGGWRADGGPLRPVGGIGLDGGPRFDAAIGPGGYSWWYIDAMSADGRYGLTVIAFIGSVFSPWYAWSGRANPENHCAMNIAFYGPDCARWAMTERGAASLQRDASHLAIGPSSLTWDGDDLLIRFEEITAPVPPMPMRLDPVRGCIRVSPTALNARTFPLDAEGRHSWRPIAPRARVQVTLDEPSLSWSGEGYFDTNAGVEPLEDAFESWDWSRAHLKQDSAVLYDLKRRDGSEMSLALRFDAQGRGEETDLPPRTPMRRTIWQMPRVTRADLGKPVVVNRTWEDTPFYSRSAIGTHLLGEACEGIHESLSLTRLKSPFVRAMLPFRMPRAIR